MPIHEITSANILIVRWLYMDEYLVYHNVHTSKNDSLATTILYIY